MRVSLETTRTNEKKEVIQTFSKVDVKVDYFWDNHGNLIKFNDSVKEPKSWSDVEVQLVLYSFTENLLGKSFDFQCRQLVIDDKVISGDLIDCIVNTGSSTQKTCLHCRVTVGWG